MGACPLDDAPAGERMYCEAGAAGEGLDVGSWAGWLLSENPGKIRLNIASCNLRHSVVHCMYWRTHAGILDWRNKMSNRMDYKGYAIEIWQDESAEDPRDFDGNITKIAFFHRRHRFANESGLNERDYNSWEELKQAIVEEEKPALILPVYMMDHSGLTFRLGNDFSDCGYYGAFDSGQVGFIYITEDQAKQYEEDGISRDRLQGIVESEFKEYACYLSGEVYGFTVDEDSYGGYYGFDAVRKAAREFVESILSTQDKSNFLFSENKF